MQGHLHRKLVLGGQRGSGTPPAPARIVKVRKEALTGLFRQVCKPGGLNTLFFQIYVRENGSHCGNSGQDVHFKDRGGG